MCAEKSPRAPRREVLKKESRREKEERMKMKLTGGVDYSQKQSNKKESKKKSVSE